MVKFCLIKFFKLINPKNWKVANWDNEGLLIWELFGKVPYFPLMGKIESFNTFLPLTYFERETISSVFIISNGCIYLIPNKDVYLFDVLPKLKVVRLVNDLSSYIFLKNKILFWLVVLILRVRIFFVTKSLKIKASENENEYLKI